MITRFDHAVLAVRDLGQATDRYRNVLGMDVYPGGRHAGRGTHNAIVRFGLDYLELLSIDDRSEALAAGIRRASLVDYLDRWEGGMVGYCLACDDLDALADRFERTGLEAMGPFDMERLRPDGVLLRWRLVVPGNNSWRRPWPFFIQWEMSDGERLQLETPGQHPLGVNGVIGVSVVVEDLEAACYLYEEQIGLEIIAEEVIEPLQARSIRFKVAGTTIELLAPTGDGPAQRHVDTHGEGLFDLVLHSPDRAKSLAVLEQASVAVEPAPERPNSWVIAPTTALGARFVLSE